MFRLNHSRRLLGGVAAAAGVLLVVSACSAAEPAGPADDEGFGSGDRVTIIIPTAAGGGLDTTFRQIQPAFQDALGATVVVENVEGGNTAIGGTRAANDTDCTTVLAQAIPHLLFSYLNQSVDYDLDSFAPIAGVTIEPSVIRVANDAPWKTIEDLIDDAKKRPGQITFSVSEQASSNYPALLAIEKELGVDFNIVPFGGGNPARIAVVSGEVDATHAGAFGSLGIAEDSRVLAVDEPENLWPDVTDNAPTMSEVFGVEPRSTGSTYNLWASKSCAEDHEQRYQQLIDAARTALADESYLASLDELGERSKVHYLEPEDLLEATEATEVELKELIAKDPEVFTSR
jgi:tripartite-type tricarboxylate transporter receptor subunit TctC